MNRNSNDCGLLIVGGGPAGTSAAIHLAMQGKHVTLVEKEKFPRQKLCGEFISPECLDHFARLGVGAAMLTAGGTSITKTVFYSSRGTNVAVPSHWFGSTDGGGGGRNHALGLSRAEMDERLLARARAVGVEVLEEAQVVDLLIEDGQVCGVRLKVDGDVRPVRAHLTIDATGRSRTLARRVEFVENIKAGARQGRQRAALVAFKTHVEGAQVAEGCCEIYFYPGGYGGLNQIEAGRSNLCFIASARDVRACGGAVAGERAETVLREIVFANKRARRTLAEARVCSPWLSVALDSFGHRQLAPIDGLLTVGDAASFIDPFTGSGMLMALESGELAASAIADWLCSHRSNNQSFAQLAHTYHTLYHNRFSARLRLCAVLRHAAFAHGLAIEAAISALSANERVRRRLVRATRGGRLEPSDHLISEGAS